jgi:hypothetical protein
MGGDMWTQAKRHKVLGLQRDAMQRQADRDIAVKGLDDELLAYLQNGGATPEVGDPLEGGAAPPMSGMDAAPPQGVSPQGGMQVPSVESAAPPAMGMRPPGQTRPNFADPEFQNQMNTLLQRRALAGGNSQDYERLNAAALQQQYAREDAEYARSVVSDPNGEAAKAARLWINNSSTHINVKSVEGGFTVFSVAHGDGYDEVKVSPADLAAIAMGMRKLERGDPSGLEMIRTVNKELAAAVRDDMKFQFEVGKENNDTAGARGTLGVQQGELALRRDEAASTAAYRTGSLANDAERNRIASQSAENRAPREMSPETIQQLNDLSVEIDEATDPAQRRALIERWNRMYSVGATEIGKTVTPRAMGNDPMEKERFTAFAEARAALGPNPPRGAIQQLIDEFRVGHLVGGDGSGGIPAWPEQSAADDRRNYESVLRGLNRMPLAGSVPLSQPPAAAPEPPPARGGLLNPMRDITGEVPTRHPLDRDWR